MSAKFPRGGANPFSAIRLYSMLHTVLNMFTMSTKHTNNTCFKNKSKQLSHERDVCNIGKGHTRVNYKQRT